MMQNLFVVSALIGLFSQFWILISFVLIIIRYILGIEKYEYTEDTETQSRHLAKVITKHNQWHIGVTSIPGLGFIVSGTCISLWPRFFLGCISCNADQYGSNNSSSTTKFNVTIWCRKSTHDWLMKMQKQTNTKSRLTLERTYTNWHEPVLLLQEDGKLNIKCTKTQRTVIDRIIKLYHDPVSVDLKGRHVVIVYLYGPPGTGKSKVSEIIAQELNGVYTQTNPTRMGESCRRVIRSHDSTYDCPLIIEMPDYDKAFEECMKSKSDRMDRFKPEVSDLQSHNAMMDSFHRKDNLIVIITGNKSHTEISAKVREADISESNVLESECEESEFDEYGSVFRKGRLDFTFEFTDEDRIYLRNGDINYAIFDKK